MDTGDGKECRAATTLRLLVGRLSTQLVAGNHGLAMGQELALSGEPVDFTLPKCWRGA
jgi:hypothetical protein